MLKNLGFTVVMLFSSMVFAQPAPEFIATSIVGTAYQTPEDAMPLAELHLQNNAQEICNKRAEDSGGVDSVKAVRVTPVKFENKFYVLRLRAGFVCILAQ